jgi:hypothetical protein
MPHPFETYLQSFNRANLRIVRLHSLCKRRNRATGRISRTEQLSVKVEAAVTARTIKG